jgi:hypothetical protein
MDLIGKKSRTTLIFCLAFASALACSKTQEKVNPAPPSQAKAATQATPKQVAQSATTAPGLVEAKSKTSSVADICNAGFEEALDVIERQDFPFRTGSCLTAIGSSCPVLSDAITRAALKASAEPRKKRSKTLYEAIKNRLPPDCRTKDPSASADSLGKSCINERHDLSPRLVSDMDAGTFSFFLVVEEELKDKNVYGPKARRVLLNLLLTTAMDGEKRKTSK